MNNTMHVIFGTGQIGNRIAQRLIARGHRVRMVSRSAKAPAGVEVRAGDARDVAFAREAARGAAVVYDTLNPLYQDWKRDLVPLGAGPLGAAIANGAKLVALAASTGTARRPARLRSTRPSSRARRRARCAPSSPRSGSMRWLAATSG